MSERVHLTTDAVKFREHRYEDDDPLDNVHDDPLPEDEADPECVECGGQGGWLRYIGRYDQETEWVECPCVCG